MNPNQQNIRQLFTPEKVESEFLRDKKINRESNNDY